MKTLKEIAKEAEKEAERQIKERADAMKSETMYKPDIKVNLMSGKIEGKRKNGKTTENIRRRRKSI